MAAPNNMPDLHSARLLHIHELSSWQPNPRHANSVRLLGRVVSMDAASATATLSYHGTTLTINTSAVDASLLRPGLLVQVLGELQQSRTTPVHRHAHDHHHHHRQLVARIIRDMSGLDTDLYDRCLRIRRDFENKVLDRLPQ